MSVFLEVPWNESYSPSRRNLGLHFFPSIQNIAIYRSFQPIAAVSRDRMWTRWALNRKKVAWNWKDRQLARGRNRRVRERASEGGNEFQHTFWRENSSRRTETSWENGNSRGITRFLNILRCRLSDSSSE